MLTFLLASSLAFARSSASSVAKVDGAPQGADLALDGLLGTGWAEGAPGHGDGGWWEVDLGVPTVLETLSLWPGNLKEGAKSFREYGRPKIVKLLVDGKQVGEDVRLTDEMQRRDIAMPDGTKGKVIRVEVVEAYEGAIYADGYLSEFAVNFTDGERAKAVAKVDAWRTSKEGEKLQAKHEEEVVKAFDTHKADTSEEKAFGFLMDAAGEGAPYLRRKVGALVPEGYRAAALVPDPKAMEALLKLKDPNGIPGLEMAALRAMGKDQKKIRSNVEYLYAYQDLNSGGRRNIKAWGDAGWEPGALRSFGEPMALEIDRFGQVWVADTANNRVQRFTQEGVADKQIGAPKDVSERWFGKRRTWYAAGSNASDESGFFVNTLDVELLPGKEDDRLAVLDAAGRVQLFGPEGGILKGWNANLDHQAQDKVGGEGYLAWLPRKKVLLVVIGDQVGRFDLEGEKVGDDWKISDGTPNAVEVTPDGTLWMTFGSDVVTYNADGFRYGKQFGEEVLGEGFEDVDLTLDETGRMWALTDTGWVFNFKKPGKLEWEVQVTDVELVHPRIAVSQGMVFVTDRDRILKMDALQKHTDAVQAAEEAAEGAQK